MSDMQRKPQPVLLVNSKVARTYVRLVALATNHRQRYVSLWSGHIPC